MQMLSISSTTDVGVGTISVFCGLRCGYGCGWHLIFRMYTGLRSWMGLCMLSKDEVEALLVRVWR